MSLRPSLSQAFGDAASTRNGHSCDDLTGRSVICFPGRGPLDAAVAAMMMQLLQRAGCHVRAQSRDSAQRDGTSPLEEGADAVCILGLFDDGSFRRIQPLVQQAGTARVLIGVRRSDDAAPVAVGAHGLLPSLSSICDAVRAVGLTPGGKTT